MYNYFNVKSTNLINLIFISLLSLLGFHQGSEVLVGWGFYVVVVPIVALSIIRLAHRIKIFLMNLESRNMLLTGFICWKSESTIRSQYYIHKISNKTWRSSLRYSLLSRLQLRVRIERELSDTAHTKSSLHLYVSIISTGWSPLIVEKTFKKQKKK